MKKFLAMLLVLVMVLPMCLVAQAGEIDPNAKPFYFCNWLSVEKYNLGNAYDVYMLWQRQPQKGAESLYMTAMNDEAEPTPVGHAEAMYKKFASYPEGARYIYIPSTALAALAVDEIFLDEGVELTKEYYKELITEYYILGGELDGAVYDFEYNPSQSYYISQAYQQDPELFKRIVENPRYQETIRPMLVERGFKFYEDNAYSEIYGVYSKSGDEYAQSRTIWDAVMRDFINMQMQEAASPIFKYFKKATLSDYRRQDTKSWQKAMGQSGGLLGTGGHINALGNDVGNVTNENAYFYRPSTGYYVDSKSKAPTFNKPIGYNNVHYEATPFNQFLWMMNDYKNMALSNEEGLLQVWLGSYNYMDPAENPSTACFTPYYTETLLHIGMLNPKPFLGWVTEGSTHTSEDAPNEYAKCIKIISDTLHELTRVVGAADRKPILTQQNWNSSFVMSGMYAGGRNVWRLTPNTYTGTTVEAFKVEGTDPTFYIDGQTITFPSGKIIENGSVYEAGFCGYWIEMPTDVDPVIVSDVDRYEMYPAFQENYNSYEVGMDYNYNNVNPVTSWLMKKDKNSTAVVQADKDNAENKVLALTGTHTLKNVIAPGKITAGDTTAEEQAWEVTVTLPEKMADKAEVSVLSLYNADTYKAIDGGIKFADGKVYYANSEMKYTELDGVNVSKGGKFKVKRLVDLNNAEALVSDYEIYDAEGKLLGSVQDVPFGKGVTLPIEGIGISCANVEGDPVLVDDYKLYATGVTTDLELYEKHIGMKIEDMEKATDKEVVARLAWMNATADEKEYSVVAEYYNGDTKESTKTIKKVKMGHGMDGVEIVEIPAKEGQSVLVYMKDITKAKPVEDDKGATSGLSIGAIIAIVAAAVVVLAGAVIGTLLILKKKKATAAPAVADAEFAEIATAVEAETAEEVTPEEPTAE